MEFYLDFQEIPTKIPTKTGARGLGKPRTRPAPPPRVGVRKTPRLIIRRIVLVDFRYTSDAVGHIRLYEAGSTHDMPRALAHAAAKRDLVALEQPLDWEAPSILRPLDIN
jgi:hypothetical protein